MEELIKYLNDKFGSDNESYTYTEGKQYNKVIRTAWQQGSAYAFVARNTFNNKGMGRVTEGDVFKASSWTVPAKHARATLADHSTWESLGAYSPAYLK